MMISVNPNLLGVQVKSILLYFFSAIAATIVISVGLVTSTQVSGYHLQNVYFSVNKEMCTCDCWDGFFRGVHSRGGYKLFYFNYEKGIIVILCILLFYGELLRETLLNMFLRKKFILSLLVPAIYSNFYGVWAIINYINDRDYDRMLKSQVYFSVTELLASYIFYQCLITKNKQEISTTMIYLLCTISSLHLILAFGELNIDRIGRNLGLILSDLINLGYITKLCLENQRFRPNRRTICKWLFITLCLWLFYHIFCPFRESLEKSSV